ncbi:MAG TPA: hypothetical protein DCL52_05010 [Flavobacteriaceae bacterium]|nr:hypothetical protein [Ulvibacter sp.]HAH34128.1 hypothetical protein [Flavobacteriaceae bacterium]|tara:strand:+ start:857 stop:1321 length:465 start_codon:yes stop_codon:yes gene_type:complete
MSKNKKYSILIISLLVINTILVGFVIIKPKRPLGKENKNPKEVIIKKLQFNEAQITLYTSLVKQHRKAIKEKDTQIRSSKKNLYTLLSNHTIVTTQKDSIFTSLGVLQKDIEMLHFKHFQDIKKICNPSQEESFNALAKNLASLFKGQKKRQKK